MRISLTCLAFAIAFSSAFVWGEISSSILRAKGGGASVIYL
jgi:hypothetical protein